MTLTDGAAQVLVYLLGAGVVGLVTGLLMTRRELAAFKLHVAENYLKREGLTDLKDEVKEMRGVVFQIAGKLGITVARGS